MGNLSEELMAKLNVETVFTIPIFGGIPVPESVVVTWVIMAILVVAAILLTRNLKVIPTGKTADSAGICSGKAEWLF